VQSAGQNYQRRLPTHRRPNRAPRNQPRPRPARRRKYRGSSSWPRVSGRHSVQDAVWQVLLACCRRDCEISALGVWRSKVVFRFQECGWKKGRRACRPFHERFRRRGPRSQADSEYRRDRFLGYHLHGWLYEDLAEGAGIGLGPSGPHG
jgi:hypothetical protein